MNLVNFPLLLCCVSFHKRSDANTIYASTKITISNSSSSYYSHLTKFPIPNRVRSHTKELKNGANNTKPGCLAKTNNKKKKIQQRKVVKKTEKAHTKSSRNEVAKRPSQKYIIIHPSLPGRLARTSLCSSFCIPS